MRRFQRVAGSGAAEYAAPFRTIEGPVGFRVMGQVLLRWHLLRQSQVRTQEIRICDGLGETMHYAIILIL